jgi:transposase-like protein
MSSVPEQAAQAIPVIQVNHEEVHRHLDAVVRDSVEATLNARLEAEADELCGARRYQRSSERLDTRAGHYTRRLHTRAGPVELNVPKLRNLPFETAIIQRYRRRETSVEKALVEMYLAGVSTRRVEDITEALWGTRVSSSTVSELNKKIYGAPSSSGGAVDLVGMVDLVDLVGIWCLHLVKPGHRPATSRPAALPRHC